MNIDIDSLVTFLIMWGIPTFMVVRTYLKMDSDDRNDAYDACMKTELKILPRKRELLM